MWFQRNKILLAALIIGGLIRACFLFLFFQDFAADPDAYKQIAVNIRTQGIYGQAFGKPSSANMTAPKTNGPERNEPDKIEPEINQPETIVQPTAFRPPLYPLVLSLMVTPDAQGNQNVSPIGLAILHWLLGLATMFLAFEIGRNFQIAPLGCLALTLLVACDPIALRQSSLPMTETAAILLATLGLWVFSRRRSNSHFYFVGVGLLLGVFTLCRPTFLIWSGLIFLTLMAGWFTRSQSLRQRTVSGLLFLLGIGVALAPWTVRNYLIFGKPIFATSHGGYTIFLGNNDSFYDYLRSGKNSTWDGEQELRETVLKIRRQSLKDANHSAGKIVDEVKKDRLYYQHAKEVVLRRPLDFVYACGVRVVRFWSLFPKNSASVNHRVADNKGADNNEKGSREVLIQYAAAVWYGSLFFFAIIGMARIALVDRKQQKLRSTLFFHWLPSILLVVAFQGLHLVYWSNMRMRAPLMVVIALLAVIGASGTGRKQNEQEADFEDPAIG